MHKITDIFSYATEKEISLQELEKIFYQSKDDIIKASYKVLFAQKDLNLSTVHILASNEMQNDGKSVAYIVSENNEIVAIVGYKN